MITTFGWMVSAIVKSVASTFDSRVSDYMPYIPGACYEHLRKAYDKMVPSVPRCTSFFGGVWHDSGIKQVIGRSLRHTSHQTMYDDRLGRRGDYVGRQIVATPDFALLPMGRLEMDRTQLVVGGRKVRCDDVLLNRQPTLTPSLMPRHENVEVDDIDIKASKEELKKMYEDADKIKKQNRSGWRRK